MMRWEEAVEESGESRNVVRFGEVPVVAGG